MDVNVWEVIFETKSCFFYRWTFWEDAVLPRTPPHSRSAARVIANHFKGRLESYCFFFLCLYIPTTARAVGWFGGWLALWPDCYLPSVRRSSLAQCKTARHWMHSCVSVCLCLLVVGMGRRLGFDAVLVLVGPQQAESKSRLRLCWLCVGGPSDPGECVKRGTVWEVRG